MEDKIAREGTLVRCDADPLAAQGDIECANARRAEATIALREERERYEAYEAESQRRIEELNRRIAEREALAREAALEAINAEREAYELRWREQLELSSGQTQALSAAGIAMPPGADSEAPAAPLAPGGETDEAAAQDSFADLVEP